LACGSFGELVCEKSKKTVEKNDKTLEYQELYYGTQSDILKLEVDTQEDLKAINFGLAMHYMLEMLGSFELSSIPHAKSMMLNKFGDSLDPQEIDDIKNRITMLVSSKEFLELITGECYREKAIRYKNNLRYIDLLVDNHGMWNIIDYKSSTNYSEHHIKQVRYYKKAIKEITGDEVEGYLCYLLEDNIKLVRI
jgi:exodeoxyribonuclease V beta subunit